MWKPLCFVKRTRLTIPTVSMLYKTHPWSRHFSEIYTTKTKVAGQITSYWTCAVDGRLPLGKDQHPLKRDTSKIRPYWLGPNCVWIRGGGGLHCTPLVPLFHSQFPILWHAGVELMSCTLIVAHNVLNALFWISCIPSNKDIMKRRWF